MQQDLLERPASGRTLEQEVAYQTALCEANRRDGLSRLHTSVREVSAETTLATIVPLFGAFGISQMIDVSLDGVPGCPVFQVIRDDMRSVFFNAGKGFTRVESMVSGLMEAIEVHCFERADPARIASGHVLALESPGIPLVDPAALSDGRIKRVPLDPGKAPLLVRGVDHRSGEALAFHAGSVFLEFSDDENAIASPNGIASGNSVTEALCHALCEILERHALAGFYQQGKSSNNIMYQQLERVEPPQGVPRLDVCLGQLALRDIVPEFILISTEAGVSVFICFLDIPMGGGVRGAVQGYGAHHDPKIAMCRALGEAVQILALCPVTDVGAAAAAEERVVMTSKQSAALDPHAVASQRVSDHAFLQSLRCRVELIDFDYASFPDDAGLPMTTEQTLGKLLDGLEGMGCANVCSCVISPPSLPVVVVKCFCPGLDSIPGL